MSIIRKADRNDRIGRNGRLVSGISVGSEEGAWIADGLRPARPASARHGCVPLHAERRPASAKRARHPGRAIREHAFIDPVLPVLADPRLRNVIEHDVVSGNWLHDASAFTTRAEWYDGAGTVPDAIAEKIQQKYNATGSFPAS